MWRYSLRWRCPHIPCTGEPVPDNILSRFTAGGDYAVCLDFLAERPVKRWPPKRKAQSRCGIFFCLSDALYRSLQRQVPRRWHSSRQGGNVNDVALLLMRCSWSFRLYSFCLFVAA